MTAFHNPYHFIPFVKGSGGHNAWDTAIGDIGKREVTHDRYVSGCLSGRIRCRLTTVTPVLVGNEHVSLGNRGTLVKPYCVPSGETEQGVPALPAASLRGCIGVVHEALTNSAPRVLEDRVLSRRSTMAKALSAIGVLFRDRRNDGWRIFPLCLPNWFNQVPRRSRNPTPLASINARQAIWRKLFPDRPRLKAYVGDSRSIRNDPLTYLSENLLPPQDSQGNYPEPQWQSHPMPTLSWQESRDPHDVQWKIRVSQDGGLNQKGSVVVSVFGGSKSKKMWCLVRALGVDSNRSDIPRNKKHEVLLPLGEGDHPPSEVEQLDLEDAYFQKQPNAVKPDVIRSIPVSSQAFETFMALSRERHELANQGKEGTALLPYHPIGLRPNRDPMEPLAPQEGDTVYFDAVWTDEVGGEIEVSRFAYSSIWRESIADVKGRPKSVHDFVRDLDPRLVSDGDWLTPTEALFGTVRDNLGLASRVRFSDGVLSAECASTEELFDRAGGLQENSPAWKELSSPKPPSANLYFGARPRKLGQTVEAVKGGIRKGTLSFERHAPRGRKTYLHHSQDKVNARGDLRYWESFCPEEDSSTQRKVRGNPLRSGLEFVFSVDFDNLSEAELGSLLLAIEPGKGCLHHLGLGKPLGLGSVSIAVEAVEVCPRGDRYGDSGFMTPRYRKMSNVEELRSLALKGEAPLVGNQMFDVLCALMDPQRVTFDVHYPMRHDQSMDQLSGERKLYEWFVKNDKSNNPQCLGNVSSTAKELPSLEKN